MVKEMITVCVCCVASVAVNVRVYVPGAAEVETVMETEAVPPESVTGEMATPAGAPVAVTLTWPELPVTVRERVTGDPPAAALTLGVLALTDKVEAGGGVLELTLLLLEPEPPHPRRNKGQKRVTDAANLQAFHGKGMVRQLQGAGLVRAH
jgi:hypothetical protein